MLGIDDPYIWMAYLLCLASTALCVIYALIARRRGEVRPDADDIRWVTEERKVEEET